MFERVRVWAQPYSFAILLGASITHDVTPRGDIDSMEYLAFLAGGNYTLEMEY